MRTALGALGVLALSLAARSAEAQAVLHDEGRYRSSQHWALEVRLGPYSPDVDSEFKDAATPHETYFGSKRRVMAQLELDYQFFHLFGSAALGAQVGYFRESANSFNVAGNARTADKTALLLVPMALQLVYRMDEAAKRWNVPVVPYVKAGLSYTIWRISDSNGDVAHSATGQSGRGGTPGWQAAVGVSLLLDFLDPSSARALDGETGVNHTYLFVEGARYDASGLGRKKVLKVGDTTWVAGLMFEF
jgi:hypothetical protein